MARPFKIVDSPGLVALVAVWCALSVVALVTPPSQVSIPIHGFAALGIAAALYLWRQAEHLHLYSLSPLHIFALTGAGYFVAMPWLSVLLGYHYLLLDTERHGVLLLLQTEFWILILFYAFYAQAVGASQLVPIERPERVRDSGIARPVVWVGAGVAIGVLAFGWLYYQLEGAFGQGYVELSQALRGSGWIIRAAELLALAGLLLLAHGNASGTRRAVWTGLLLIAVYAVLRAPFENRENVVRFFLLALLYYTMSRDSRLPTRTFLMAGGCAALLITFLPLFSYLRGGQGLGVWADLYTYFLFRDLNFAEVISTLLAREQGAGEVGVLEALRSIASAFVPRDLWPDKPFPLSVAITSWVTPVAGYDIDEPLYAYGTGFMGAAYAAYGLSLCLVASALLGWIAGRLVRWARRPRVSTRAELRLLLGAVCTYFGAFAIQKLDPGNVIPSILFPMFFLLSLYVAEGSRGEPRASVLARQ